MWLLDNLWLLKSFFRGLLWNGAVVTACSFRRLPPCWVVCPIRPRVAVFGFVAHFAACFTGVFCVCIRGFFSSFTSVRLPTVAEEMTWVATAKAWSCDVWYSFLAGVRCGFYVVDTCKRCGSGVG